VPYYKSRVEPLTLLHHILPVSHPFHANYRKKFDMINRKKIYDMRRL